MQQVSSNLTLVFKLFFPIFWVVFFGLLTLSAWVVSPESGGALARWDIRLVISAVFLSGVGLLYFSLWKLKRVEMDADFVFATDYFRTVRNPGAMSPSCQSSSISSFRSSISTCTLPVFRKADRIPCEQVPLEVVSGSQPRNSSPGGSLTEP